MDWKRYDLIRRKASPLEVDLIESYAAGKISRRDFTKRGVILGLGTTTMAAVIAACGSDDEGDTGTGSDTTAAPDDSGSDTTAAPVGG